MKSYTDIEQSKKLEEILPLESADMYWFRNNVETPKIFPNNMMKDSVSVTLPCWSLAALLNVLQGYTLMNNVFSEKIALWRRENSVEYNNPIDACYEMILKLNDMKML